MNACPSTFYNSPCDRAEGHNGAHQHADSSGHIVTWTTLAADA